MKKIYYLLAFISIVAVSCKPLSKTYDDIDSAPAPKGTSLSLNLSTAEYKLLPSAAYAYTSLNFRSATDANLYIPTILNAKYPNAANLTSLNATFALSPYSSNIAVPDSTYSRIAITLNTTADYAFPAYVINGNSIAGNTLGYFSTAVAQNYLSYKFPTPAAYQMVVLTYLYFESGVTATTGTQTTDTYIYLNGTWTKIYTLSAADYALVNRGVNNWFVATDIPNLVYYINSILKSDPTVMATVKAGDIKYVSYRYTTTYQKIATLTYDGTNFVLRQTLAFLKLNGVWVPDPTVVITEPVGVNADYAYLNTLNIGSSSARANLASFGDFYILSTSSANYWSDDDIKAAFAAILLHRIANPIIGVPYKVVYSVYNGSVSVTSRNYLFDGSVFVGQ